MSNVITGVDIMNAALYASNRLNFVFLKDWRVQFPHILVDYTIRWATTRDYYVPPALRLVNAVVVEIDFSQEGCEAMSCYPFTETGVIDFKETPIGGFTQTSNTSVQYNQPACFHLNVSKAARDEQIQSVELRYARNRCIMVDSFTKMYFNSPYLRTEEHVVAGVDDVPGFDVHYDDNVNFPERVRGRFNQAYCRRFGRQEDNNSCTRHWYETFVSFILGESIYTSFKLINQNVFAELRDFDYEHPSPALPPKPEPGGEPLLDSWRNVRDRTYDESVELGFLENKFGFPLDQMLLYRANRGFMYTGLGNKVDRDLIDGILYKRLQLMRRTTSGSSGTTFTIKRDAAGNISPEQELEDIMTNFLEDHDLIMSILTDLGFDVLEHVVTTLLKNLNKILIPALKKMLMDGSRVFTAALLGNTYRAMAVHALNRTLINSVTAVAKAMVRGVSAALSIANVLLTFLTIADFVLMIWDPFGYNNMFPRGYLDDLSDAFLYGYYESIGESSRDFIAFRPIHFSHLLDSSIEDDVMDLGLYSAEYFANLDVNSNGQLVDLTGGGLIDDFDAEEMVGACLSTTDTFVYFRWYCARHDKLLRTEPVMKLNVLFGCFGLVFAGGAIVYYAVNYNSLRPEQRVIISIVFLILVLMCMILIILPSLRYYTALARHNVRAIDDKESQDKD